jgi:hypothetical protein
VSSTLHIVGRGIVATRIQRLLIGHRSIVHDPRWSDVGGVSDGDIAVLAQGGNHAAIARRLLERGLHVLTVGESLADTRNLLQLDRLATTNRRSLVIGAAMSPGLAGLIARYLVAQLASADEIHIAIHGTAGPACARTHHRSLSHKSMAWHDGVWIEPVGGSGRELCWFPEPIGAKDCYHAGTASPLLIQRSFPSVERITARRSARRRDRFTARLPMLRAPHVEGGVGALRVEVRGADELGGRRCLIAGVAELVGTATAATAAAFTDCLADGRLPVGVCVAGDKDLPTTDLLRGIERFGVRLQEFTGVPQGS